MRSVISFISLIFKRFDRASISELPWYENTAVNVIDVDERGNFSVISDNDVSHLEDAEGLNIPTFALVDQYIEKAKNSANLKG